MPADPLDPTVTEALRGLRVQLDAGLETVRALDLSADLCASPEARAAFREAALRARRGDEIDALLAPLAPLLSTVERAVVAAGWRSGRLSAMLEAVVQQREVRGRARGRIRAKMLMPAFLLGFGCLVLGLPRLVRGDVAGYLRGALVPAALGALAWAGLTRVMWPRHGPARDAGPTAPAPPTRLDHAKLRLPVLAALERARCLAEFASGLGNLLLAGIPINTALAICAGAVSNGVYREAIAAAARATTGGAPLTQALADQPPWPRAFVAAVEVAERSGTLDEGLLRQGQLHRERYEGAVHALAEWLPRLAYVAVVGFIAYAIITGLPRPSRAGGAFAP